MVGANSKILTVSYGTFSCTLEGFDEPFNTMKAIAEYFRDLAADDRYFGAEPPTPDAEMLHKIAEREIQRRVEAKMETNGLILRPADRVPAEMPAPQAETPAEAQAVTPPMAEPAAQAPVSVEPAPRTETAAIAAPAGPESVAEKLQRIRSAVAQARASAARQDDYLEDQPEREPVATFSSLEDATPGVESEDFGYELDISGPLNAAELESHEPVAEEVAAEEPSEESPTEEVVAAVPEVDTEAEDEARRARIAERMKRRAARAAALAAAAAEEVRSQTTAPELEEDPAEVEAEAPVTVAEAAAEDVEQDAALEAEAEAEAETFEIDSLMSSLAESHELEAPVEDVAPEGLDEVTEDTIAAALADFEQQDEAEDKPRIRARVIKVRRSEPADATTTTPEIEDAETIADENVAHDDLASAEPVAEEEATLSPEAEADLMRELAALEEDTHTQDAPDIEDAAYADMPLPVQHDDAAEAAELDDGQMDVDAVEAETVIEEAEVEEAEVETAEIEAPEVAEIAALEDMAEPVLETAESAFEAETESAVQESEAPEAEPPVEEAFEATDATPEEAAQEDRPKRAEHERELTRLMDKADSQLSVPENRRRLSAISHLKAAVAATVADRRALGQDTAKGAQDEDKSEAYREDLTHAVRPRRPVSKHAQTARPEIAPARPTPLVLVSEQRVDRDATDTSEAVRPTAVRPRRVSAAQVMQVEADEDEAETDAAPLSAEDATSFAEFAEGLGTQGLSDLLEAAAAYTAGVEGRPHFSPPQIMRKLTSVDGGEEFTREDRLRVFGKLLRQGKITKVKRGQYAITEASRYWNEAKRAG